MPSSPTEALRMRRLAAGPSSRVAHERSRAAPDRPIKRRKLSPPGELPVVSYEAAYAEPTKRGSSAATSVTSRHSKWRFDGVEIKTVQGHKRRTPNGDSSTPKQSKMTAAQLPSPEVPSPAVAAARSSDDYDAWEVPLCADDDMDIVPDSQPSCDEGEDDSMLPSFMKEQKGKARPFADETEKSDLPALAEDALMPSRKALGKRPQHTSRMQTAPPSYLRKMLTPRSVNMGKSRLRLCSEPTLHSRSLKGCRTSTICWSKMDRS